MMAMAQATRILSRSYVTMGRLRSNTQIQPVLTKQLRLKQTFTSDKKRCPDKQPGQKGRKLKTALGVAVVGTTLAVIAAKHDEDFREWAKENIPLLDDLVRVAYEEEESYLEFMERKYKELIKGFKQALYDMFQAKETAAPKKKSAVSEDCSEAQKPYKAPESAFVVVKDEGAKVESSKKADPVPKYMKELKNLEDKLAHAAEDTIQSYHAVICAIKDQGVLIDNLDQMISKHDCKVWAKLDRKKKDEKKFSNKAEDSVQSLENAAKQLESRLESDSNLTDDIKAKAKSNLAILMGDIKQVKGSLNKEKEKAILAKRAWDKVRQARMHFSEELETLFPNVWLNDEKLNLPLDSLDPFVQNVLNSIIQLDRELAKLQTVTESEVISAVERFKNAQDSEGLVDAAVNIEKAKETRNQQNEMQKALLTHTAKCEKNSKTMLKQAAEVYADLKVEALAMKEREVERKMRQLQEEKLANLRNEHKMEIAKLIGRIQGANEAISKRGQKDKDQQERQQFWSAAQSLLAAVKPAKSAVSQKDPKPLKNEIDIVSKVAPEKDPLVEKVVASIPQQALDRGVDCETKLKERFMCLEREARRVAAVPEGTVTLLQLFLARVQSALYINETIPPAELNNEPFEADKLNNYEILCRARHYVDRGEYDQAVRYLNLLKGPASKVASDWKRDVLVYLETAQAAETLLAHASAGGP